MERKRQRVFYLDLDLDLTQKLSFFTGQDGSYHHIHAMGQHTFNGMISQQVQQILHAKNMSSRFLPGVILVSITVRQGGPLNLGATPGVGWVGVLLLIGTLK